MAGAGYRLYTAGQVLTAAQVNTYLMEQSVMVFATTAARDAALTTIKSEGNITFQLDNNDLDIYNGSSFSTLVGNAHGAETTYTPTLTQSGAVTKTVTYAAYQRIGRRIIGNVRLDATGAGTGANAVTVSTPVTAASTTVVVGSGYIFDTSVPQIFVGACALLTNATMGIYVNGGALTPLGAQIFVAALAAGDIINLNFCYEAAADA